MSPTTPPRVRLNLKPPVTPPSASSSSTIVNVDDSDDDAYQPVGSSPTVVVKPEQFTRGEIVTIFVGHKRKRFCIYKDLLCNRTPYFAASLKNFWSGGSNDIYLQEDADAFAQFTNWLFTNEIPTVNLSTCSGLADVVAFYKLADFLLVETLKNGIIDATLKYLKEAKWAVNFFSLYYVQEQIPGTQFYRLVLRSSVRMFMNGPELFDEGADNDTTFLAGKQELMMEIVNGVRDYNKKPYDQVWKCHRCEYHEHEESVICKS
ncbi:hypothetical protein OHC33_000974 [Knufia fluminis]|uniref:BTB domain-containing protein n=1 Tax=Knufia fluminis TaxID=191047 RepID=A0AAN8IBW8_9EURO|nr:hypothetical protein OHC33_000974 [Knufia fluminis]